MSQPNQPDAAGSTAAQPASPAVPSTTRSDTTVTNATTATTSSTSSTSTSPGLFAQSAASIAHELQSTTRQQRHFAETEAGLPNLTNGAPTALAPSLVRNPQKLFQAVSAASASSSRVTDLFSFLGSHNPIPRPVTKDDSVWLLDNVAHQHPVTGHWQAEYVVAVMAQEPSCKVVDAVKSVADKLADKDGDGTSDDETLKTIEERITPFLQDILPGRQVHAVHGKDYKLLFSPGGRNGVSSDVRKLPDTQPGGLVPTQAVVPEGANGMLEMQTFFAGKDGWGVISDIDDTIKLTQTSDPVGILRKTFVDPPTAIEGMPDLYKYIHGLMGPQAPFFYLSASPYNLYPFLREFRTEFYPYGPLLLRENTMMSVAGLLSTLTEGTREYKVDRMDKVHGWLPGKTFVCIGDSTQSDPEAYGEIYRTHPGWVKLILIRKVTDIAALGMAEKNEPARFEKAFEDVPKSAWHVFEEPEECYAYIKAVVGGGEVQAASAAATTA